MNNEHLYIPEADIAYDFYVGTIIPKYCIENGTVFIITHIIEMFHIKGFYIIRDGNKIKQVIIFGLHPNAHHRTNELCLSDVLLGKYVLDIEKLKKHIILMLEKYDLDDCFFKPKEDEYRIKPVDAQGKMKTIDELSKGIIKYGERFIR